jgi:hypothetical protein
MADRLFITCEHAGNVVPEEYTPLFVAHEHLLEDREFKRPLSLPVGQPDPALDARLRSLGSAVAR